MIDRRKFLRDVFRVAGVAGLARLGLSLPEIRAVSANPGSWPMPGPGRRYSSSPPPGDPNWTHFATASNGIDAAGQASVSVAVNNVPAGALVVVSVSAWSGSMGVSGVSDGTSAFTSTTATTGSIGMRVQQWYLLAANSGNRTYTATFSAGGDYPVICAQVISYTGTIAFGTSSRAEGSSTAISSGIITTAGSYPAVFGLYKVYNQAAVSSPLIGGNAWQNYTTVLADYVRAGWYDGSVASGAATGTLAAANLWACSVVAFREAA